MFTVSMEIEPSQRNTQQAQQAGVKLGAEVVEVPTSAQGVEVPAQARKDTMFQILLKQECAR